MKKLALILVFLLFASCNSNAAGKQVVPLKAVYFVHGQGELSSEDLQAHPEIVVVQTFDEFKQHTKQKVALWVDKNTTPFDTEQEKWINETPQAYYPIVLIGTSDTLYSFRDLLRLCCFMGPASDYPGYDAPGFSVIQWKEANDPDARDMILLQGFKQEPTVQAILEITNALLEGRVQPTPMGTFFPAATPTTMTSTATETRQFVLSPQPNVPTMAGTDQVLLYDEEPPGWFPNDAAHIVAVTLEKDILKIQVTYQGGCQEHIFHLYAWTAFLQSLPPQDVMYLSHDAQGDNCTKKLEKLLSFNIAPLNTERDDPTEHPLLLRILEPIGGSFTMKPYMPLIEWP